MASSIVIHTVHDHDMCGRRGRTRACIFMSDSPVLRPTTFGGRDRDPGGLDENGLSPVKSEFAFDKLVLKDFVAKFKYTRLWQTSQYQSRRWAGVLVLLIDLALVHWYHQYHVTGWVGFAWNMENPLRNTVDSHLPPRESLHFSEDHS